MHQDRYNRHTWPGNEVDGAPDWATVTDGVPCTPIEETTLCAQVATEHFWNDDPVAGEGLQEHYGDVLVALSRRLRSDQHLLGIELMNEPTPGRVAPPAFERRQLWPFYRKMIAALRADGEQRMIWFEPNLLRDVSDADSGVPQRFSEDPNLVYAPHLYTEVFSPPTKPTGSRSHLEASYTAAETEAAGYGAPLVDGEWGSDAGGGWEAWRQDQLDLQDQLRVGSAFWMWKQRPGFYDWQTVNGDGSLRSDSLRAQQLSRPHPNAVPGVLDRVLYTPQRLEIQMSGPGGVADLWSGTEVLAGGPSLISSPLTRVMLDDHPVDATLTQRAFATSQVSLLGYDLNVRIPGGTHTIVLLPGNPASGAPTSGRPPAPGADRRSSPACPARRLALRIHQPRHGRVVRVFVYLRRPIPHGRGVSRWLRIATFRGRRIKRIRLASRTGSFTLRIVASTSRGRRITTTRRFRGCAGRRHK
jgi:hypothetical protein